MTYSETLDYLYSQLPMFHRIGAAAYKPDLSNIIALTERMNHPERKFRTIHVAGTNGKGSVSNMLASVLQESGYKTGLFTSPHLKDFRERIRIDGKMIEEDVVTKFVEEFRRLFDDVGPSFFEWTTALGFKYFADEAVDVAVIETGLGGRLDSTNIITPELSIITNISYDHMHLLGNTLHLIAGEKAGIIKQNIPVVIGERQEESEQVFLDHSKEKNSDIVFASDNYSAEIISSYEEGQSLKISRNGKTLFDDLYINLPGNYQVMNICTVLQSLDVLKKLFPKINNSSMISGLKNIRKNTGLQGRWQVINHDPLTIVDVGHNQAGIKFVMDQLSTLTQSNLNSEKVTQLSLGSTRTFDLANPKLKTKNSNLHVVFGMVNDKDPSGILSLLPPQAEYYFCKADLPRAMDADELKKEAAAFKLTGDSFSSVAEALKAARRKAGKDDLIFVGGSTFVVAEVI